jgi:hypothetical protein
MPSEFKHTCRDCKWARWQRTKSGRVNPNHGGVCLAPVPEVALPASITKAYGFSPLCRAHRTSIWPMAPFKDCPTWEEKA